MLGLDIYFFSLTATITIIFCIKKILGLSLGPNQEIIY